MTQSLRDQFKAGLADLDAESFDLIVEVTRLLLAAQDTGDPRPPEVILGPTLARAGIEWPAKEDEVHDRRTT